MTEQQGIPPVHVMLDIETLGTRPGSAILSIGACTFGCGLAMSFSRRIQLVGQDKLGLHMDPDTVLWWLKQGDAARAALTAQHGRVPLPDALRAFSDWLSHEVLPIEEDLAPLRIWGNGASFDPVLLEAAYAACGWPPPWRYRDIRDLRTLLELAAVNPRDFQPAVAHDALEDARAQAAAAETAFLQLGMMPA